VDKLIKYIFVFLIFGMLITGMTYAFSNQNYDIDDDIEIIRNFPYINQQLLESSRYTQKDESNQAVLDNYHDNYYLSFTPVQIEQMGYELMFETDKLQVYFELDSFSILIKNKETNYFWSSRPEFQGTSGFREDNPLNRNQMNSGLWVEYLRTTNISPAGLSVQSLYTIAEVTYQNNGAITEDLPDITRPYMINESSYKKAKVENEIIEHNANYFKVQVNIKFLEIIFNVEISLEDDQILVYIPVDEIEEIGDTFRLMGIRVFPYLGSAREDVIPGYFVIPDGVGALVRTNQRYNASFQARFFGSDRGYGVITLPELSIPLYGIVHEAQRNAFYAHLIEGAETSQLLATFWGSGTRYHRIGARYNVRAIYKNVINKQGQGDDTISKDMTNQNFKISLNFLSNDQASYVGIAKSYQNYLVGEEVLTKREKDVDNNIPIQLSYIMSDHEPSFIGTSRVTMTRSSDIDEFYEYFKEQGLTNQLITLMGWSRDGFINKAPYRTTTWDKNGIKDLASKVIDEGNSIYLENNYTISSANASRIIFNRDVARNLNKLKMTRMSRNLNGQVSEIYFLYPERSLSFARSDLNFFNDLGVSGLQISSLGDVLFSYYDQKNYERTTSIEYYQEIASLYDSLVLMTPNQYLFQYIDGYLDMRITNSQYDYYTDLVPFIPILLKGYVSYYTPFLNFNALAEDRLLTMVDFGLNPSYVLTKEKTYEMRYTPSSMFYTTEFNQYKDEIVETYQYVNNALKHVLNETIEQRIVLETGLVRIEYSNGVIIYVNYNYQSKLTAHGFVLPRNYRVVTP
jgi:hypothetical protein